MARTIYVFGFGLVTLYTYDSLLLKFTLGPTYPDDVPVISIAETENLDEDIANTELLEGILLPLTEMWCQAEQSVGMVMVFTLVNAASEWLCNEVDSIQSRQKKEDEQKKKAKEEEERKKFEGTRVTVESFLRWKAQFEEEIRELQKKEMLARAEALAGKLTGEEAIKVDESLFQDLEGMDLEDLQDCDDS
ncbi:RWDD1 [Cordylochernes scorpioides]|uniref:RWDD1 n=1 Tax=Cordylochernes scorpioides TaxID=51811 RepID=A0ABY6KXA3_9ARAC|nr:RWDD1 [Cordylochernes scorpioides]